MIKDNVMQRSDTCSASALQQLLLSASPQEESLCTAELHQKKLSQDGPNHFPRSGLGHCPTPAPACFCILLHFSQAVSDTLGGCSRNPPAWSLWLKRRVSNKKCQKDTAFVYQCIPNQTSTFLNSNCFYPQIFKSLDGERKQNNTSTYLNTNLKPRSLCTIFPGSFTIAST